MFASGTNHSLFAFPLFKPVPSVSRCNCTPLTVTSVAACTTVVPAELDVICTVHDPVAAIVWHVFTPPTNDPGPLTIENVINVPAGALLNVTPSGATFTCPVRV